MKILLLCLTGLMTILLTIPALSEQAKNIIGLEYAGTRPGYKNTFGQLLALSAADATAGSYLYAVSIDERLKDGKLEILFEKSLGLEGKHRKWHIIDAIRLSKLNSGNVLSEICRLDEADPFLWDREFPKRFMFAVGKLKAGQIEIDQIWELDWKIHRFRKIKPDGISCFSNAQDD